MSDRENFLAKFEEIMLKNEGSLSDGFKYYTSDSTECEVKENLIRIGNLIWDSIPYEDSRSLEWLIEHSKFSLGSYVSESGDLKDATESTWRLKTDFVFEGGVEPPKDIREAISIAMNEEV